jgi:tetratricopeptide (TPR) repeat protein
MGWRRLCLAIGALLAPAAAQAAWQEATSPHFVVYSDDTPDHVKAFTAQLERYDKAMHVLRGLADKAASPSARVTVFVVRDIDAVQRLIGRDRGDVAGFYVPRAAGSVAFIPRASGDGSETALTARQILLHEYAHHVTYTAWGDTALPAWFVEGFAEFNATARFNPDGSMTFGLPPLYRAYGMFRSDEVPFRKLVSVDPNTLPDEQRSIFYGRAWLLTHYLTFDPARRKQLSDYLTRVNAGEAPLAAAAAFGDLRRLDSDLDRYVSRPRLPAITLTPALLPVGAVTVRTLGPAEVATMPALIRSKRGVDARTAPAVLALARTAAAAWPADPFAQNELAEAAYDAGRFAEADAAATRAMAADPRSVHAIMYRGLARLGASTAGHPDSAAGREARHSFGIANRLDPDDPWPLAAFYGSFAATGERASDNAATGLIYAHALAPFDTDLAMTAAHVYLDQGKADLARATLRPVAYSPHASGSAALAAATLAALDSGGTPAAIATLDGKAKAAPGRQSAGS